MGNFGRKIGKILLWVILAPLIVVLLIIAIPLFAILALTEIPAKKRATRSLNDEIRSRWLPQQKYVYLSFTAGTRLADIIETKILPEYGRYIVVNRWDPAVSAHKYTEGYEQASKWMETAHVSDYDGEYEANLVRIKPGLEFDLAFQTHYLDDDADFTAAAKDLEDEIKKTIAIWIQSKNVSDTRMLLAKGGEPYNAIFTYAEAKRHKRGYVVMDGDYGGQIYLTVPLRLVKCGEEGLEQLLKEVDALGWADPAGATLYYEELSPGEGVPGGMGGGFADIKLWVHPELENYRESIEGYLAGKTSSLAKKNS